MPEQGTEMAGQPEPLGHSWRSEDVAPGTACSGRTPTQSYFETLPTRREQMPKDPREKTPWQQRACHSASPSHPAGCSQAPLRQGRKGVQGQLTEILGAGVVSEGCHPDVSASCKEQSQATVVAVPAGLWKQGKAELWPHVCRLAEAVRP